jgi:TPR repeat protein
LRSHAEYAELGAMLPDLVGDLYASLNGQNRRSALVGLADCYMSAVSACKNLGFPDLAKVAALRIRDVTHLLSGPEWAGLAAYARGQVIGSGARQRAGALASRAAEEISGELARPEVAEVYGMLHLMAALSHTTRGQLDTAQDHVTEAAEIAARPGVGNHNFMRMWFGSGNVGFWQTALAVERGEAGKAMEIARGIDPATMPASASRQAMWRIDLGRAMALDRRTRDQAASHFLAAEGLAPQLTRSNPWVRETVTSLLGRARRDAGGRDLRGLAYRIGIAG